MLGESGKGSQRQWHLSLVRKHAEGLTKKRRLSEKDIPGTGNSICKGTDRAYNNEHDGNVEGVCVWGRDGSRWEI